jgi:GLPGLI family protein
MRIKLKIFVILLFCMDISQAQSIKEKPLIKATYLFEHLHDTTAPDKPFKETMVLFAGPTSLLYGSYENDLMTQQIQTQINSSSFNGNLVIRGSGASSETYYFHFPGRLTQSIHSIQGKKYLVEEKFPDIDWEITAETKEIKGFPCQAAIGNWGGRKYTAWFTTAIQVTGGPWKLQGLPGFVLEAYDEEREVSFMINELETLHEQTQYIATDPNLIKATHRELTRLREALQQQASASAAGGIGALQGAPVSMAGSEDILPLGGGKSNSVDNTIDATKIQSIRVERTSTARKDNTNNPLEKTKV